MALDFVVPEIMSPRVEVEVRKCQRCGSRAQVTNSRDLGTVIVRWRKCDACDVIWKTTETRG